MQALTIDIDLRRGDFSLALSETLELTGITALFGASGAGKTTLLRVIAGLEKAAGGTLLWGGTRWQHADRGIFVPPHLRSVGYVFQDGRLFPHLNVERNLLFGRRPAGGARLTLADIVDALDLNRLLKRSTASLSGGERQRVAIGRALLRSPELILMDEPLSSLDLRRKAEIIPYIEQLPAEFGVPVLYVTHDIEELARIASTMVLLAHGRVAARGSVRELLERIDLTPLTGQTEAGTVLETRVEAHTNGMTSLSVCGQALRIPRIGAATGSTARLRIRARDVALATGVPAGLSIRNVLSSRILTITADDGPYADVLLDLGSQHLRARVTREAVEELRLTEGQQVRALIKTVAFEGQLLD